MSVDIETGKVSTDYAIVEDCGTMVNPMIVEGQIFGGATWGSVQASWKKAHMMRWATCASTFADL